MGRSVDKKSKVSAPAKTYRALLAGVVSLLEEARRNSVRAVNSFMTATYWEIGRRIVEFEQGGQQRAIYGSAQLELLSEDLSQRFGRGFSVDNLENMRAVLPRVQVAVNFRDTVSEIFRASQSPRRA